MLYKKPSAADTSKQYDACYYEITPTAEAINTTQPMELHITIQKKLDMNVYIYGGNSRGNATKSIIPDNLQAEAG